MLLSSLDPKRSSAYSPNLYDWLKRHSRFEGGGGEISDKVYLSSSEDGSNELYVGSIISGSATLFFSGAKLIDVVKCGMQAGRDYRPIQPEVFQEITGFWFLYQRNGRCSMDPSHALIFGGSPRFSKSSGVIRCLWCGTLLNEITKTKAQF